MTGEVTGVTMLETEQSIRQDLELLGDALNRMEYILGCARVAPGIPETERTPEALVADCQTNTWLMAEWDNGALRLRTDSESFLVKGALYLIGEIYNGRTRSEVADYSCALLDYEKFIGLFNPEQKKGLRHVLNTLKEGGGDRVS